MGEELALALVLPFIDNQVSNRLGIVLRRWNAAAYAPCAPGGSLDAAASNAVLVCHALTGDAHAYGDAMAGQVTPGWWNDIVGPGRPIDTDR